jgi:anti-anti-sigma factor
MCPGKARRAMRYNGRPPTAPPGPSGIRPDALSFMIDKRNHPGRLAVAGDIDPATCKSLVDAVTHTLRADVHTLDIDVSGVTFCGSAGISAFLMVHRRAHEKGKTLRLVNLNSWVERVLTATGLLEHLTTPPQDVPSRQPPKRIDLRSRQPAGTREAGHPRGSERSR